MSATFWLENLKLRDHSEDLNVDGKIILKWIFRKIELEGVDCIYLAEDMDRCRDTVNTAIDIQL
jgi:hypothetical protein